MNPLALMSFTVAAGLALAGPTLAQPAASLALLQPQERMQADTGSIIKVHKRNYRHCHRTGTRRWCHGPRRPSGSHSGQARPSTGTTTE